jgi:thiosulfate reductase cytochrome b subunit
MSAIPVPARTARAERVRAVRKHHALVRLAHWAHVPLLLGLVASGLSIYWAAPVFHHARDPVTGRSDWLADLGAWIAGALRDPTPRPDAWIYDHLSFGTGQLAVALRAHWLLAYAYMATGLLYALGLVTGGGWRAILPRRRDAREAVAMVRYYLGVVPMALRRRPWPHPAVESKYNALQRGAYAAMPLAGLLVVLSGWAMHKPSQLGWLERAFGSYDGARVVHFACMLLLAGFLVPHVILVAADGWDTFRSMVTGWSLRRKEARHGG